MEQFEEILSKLTPEQKEAAMAAKSSDELLKVAEKAGYPLTEEQLKAVAAGQDFWCFTQCKCTGPCIDY